ncbi:MAG TPA: hypothetical protein VLF94_03405 [Chlamydiales bacterium]|nr:hypothetical protein [Chlamydiales bacterium]
MSAIGLVSEAFFEAPDAYPYDDSASERVGQVALAWFSIAAMCAGVPAFMKKKRIVTLTHTVTPTPVAVEVVEVAAVAPNVERAPRSSHAAEIRELFTTIANTSVLQLPLRGMRLHAIGNELRRDSVHPFEMLRCAPRESIQRIFREGSRFKIQTVIEGIREGMIRESHNLELFTPGLAADMGKSEERIRPLIQARDWRGLVEYLFDIPSLHEA